MGLPELQSIKANAGLPKEKKVYKIPKKSKKKLAQEAEAPTYKKRKAIPKISEKQKVKNKQSGGAELNRWFEERRAEMTGWCVNCGKRSCKYDDNCFKFSIAHILPKAYFPSIKTHPDNWIELCFWGKNSCHTNMDNKILDLIDMNCWDEIVVKFQNMYPYIAPKERKRIPNILLQYINTDK